MEDRDFFFPNETKILEEKIPAIEIPPSKMILVSHDAKDMT